MRVNRSVTPGFRDQASWNALLLRKTRSVSDATPGIAKEDREWRADPFPEGEIRFPGYLDTHYMEYTKAALTHNIPPDTKEKIEFTFGLYMRTFYRDPTGLFFSLLEM